MSKALQYVVVNTGSISCVGLAGYMAIHGINGWGWFLIVAVLLTASIKPGKGGDE